jgi:hypothetical protein
LPSEAADVLAFAMFIHREEEEGEEEADWKLFPKCVFP